MFKFILFYMNFILTLWLPASRMCMAQYAAVEYPPVEFVAVEYPHRELARRTHSYSIGLGILQALFTCYVRYFIISAI